MMDPDEPDKVFSDMSVKAILYLLQIPLTAHSWNCRTGMLRCHTVGGFSYSREAVLLSRDERDSIDSPGPCRGNEINARSLLYDTPTSTVKTPISIRFRDHIGR